MEPPQRSDRRDYSELRNIENQIPEPTRPETTRSPGWAQGASRPQQERSAIEWAKVANQRLEQQREQDGTTARENFERQLEKDVVSVDRAETARAIFEQQLQRDSATAAERDAAREAFEKSLRGENRNQTLEQDQIIQRNLDKERTGNF